MVIALPSDCASSGTDNMAASFHDVSDTQFSVRAVAPPDRIREYAICKALWFVEKKHVAQIALGNPVYGAATMTGPVPMKFPDGRVSLETTAYLNAPSPDGNPMFSVAEKAAVCRQGWDWYR